MDFHPYAASYPMLAGADYEAFRADIAANGIREPVLFRIVNGGERQGLDGRNRRRAAADLGIACPEALVRIPDDQVEAFIDSLNLHRRHLTVEQQQAKRRARVERVATSRTGGKSIRTIAEEERVSKSQIERDLEEAGQVSPPGTPDLEASGETPVSPAPDDSTVKGRDGKEYPASQPPKPLCDRCKRVGPVKNCSMCKELRGKPAAEPDSDKPDDAPPVDAFGTPIPKSLRATFCDPWIQSALDTLAVVEAQLRKAKLADGMNKRKGKYPFFTAKDFIDGCGFAQQYLDDLVEHLKQFRPAGVCPACDGAKCAECKMSGLVPRDLHAKLKAKRRKT